MSGLGKRCTVCGQVMREVSETLGGAWVCHNGCQPISPGDEEFAQFVFYHFGGHWLRGDYPRTKMAHLPARIARRVDELAHERRATATCEHYRWPRTGVCVKCGDGA